MRTKPLARLIAQRLHRHRQLKLLGNQMPEIDLIVRIERRRKIVFLDFLLPFADILRSRHVAEVEVGRNGQP